jgi:uncharacterized protein (DUF2249 family)
MHLKTLNVELAGTARTAHGARQLASGFLVASSDGTVVPTDQVERWMGREVDLHQGGHSRDASKVVAPNTRPCLTNVLMPPLKLFKRFDLRPLLEKGREPLPEIMKRVEALKPEQGLVIVAPFLPSPLIERLGCEGFASKFERVQGGEWVVYFWRDCSNRS